MSIACWDGRTLAVDSRRISTSRGVTTGSAGSALKKKITNDSVKLTFPESQVLFRKEEVVVVARAGKVKITKMMLDALLDGHDLEQYFRKKIDRKAIVPKGINTLLIITRQSAWQFQISGRKGVSVEHVGNQPWAIGAGNKIAVYLMKALCISPEHAVSGIIIGHSSCGGDIRIWRRGGRERTVEQLPALPDIENDERRVRLLWDAMQRIDPSNITFRK